MFRYPIIYKFSFTLFRKQCYSGFPSPSTISAAFRTRFISSKSFLINDDNCRIDDAVHDQKLDKASPLVAVDYANFDKMLECLQDGVEYRNRNTLLRALYLARLMDVERRSKFIQLSRKWWEEAEKHFSRRDFKPNKIILNLAQLNNSSDGVLLKTINWERVVDFILGRWLEIGLDKSEFKEIWGALVWIRRLCWPKFVDECQISRFNDFLIAFERYCVQKRRTRTDDELYFIIHDVMGIKLLTLFRQLGVTPSEDALRCFNVWSLLWLKRYATNRLDSIPPDVAGLLSSYAHAWIQFKYNPNFLVEASLSIWYNAFDRFLINGKTEENSPPLYNLSFPPSIAYHFDCAISFSNIFNNWNDAALKCLVSGDKRLKRIRKSGEELAGMLFSMGLLLRRNVFSIGIRKKMIHLASCLIDEFCSMDSSLISDQTIVKAVFGYSNSKQAIGDVDSMPNSVSSFLQRWCMTLREKPENQAIASRSTSDVIYALADSKNSSPDDLFDELSKTYFWGLAYSGNDIANCLWNFGSACCNLVYDPSRDSAIGEQAWPTWYQYAQGVLENHNDAQEDTYDLIQLLQVILHVTLCFRRQNEFQRLQSIWGMYVMRSVLKFKKDDLRNLFHRIRDLQVEYKIKVDADLFKTLNDLYMKDIV